KQPTESTRRGDEVDQLVGIGVRSIGRPPDGRGERPHRRNVDRVARGVPFTEVRHERTSAPQGVVGVAIALLVCGEYVNADLVDAIRTVDRELPERNAERERLRLALAEASDPGEGAAIGDAVTTGWLGRPPGGGVEGAGVGGRAAAAG